MHLAAAPRPAERSWRRKHDLLSCQARIEGLGRLGDGHHIFPLIKRLGDTKAEEARRRASERYRELPPQNGILFFNQQQKERRGKVTGEQMRGGSGGGSRRLWCVVGGVCVLRGWLVVELLVL